MITFVQFIQPDVAETWYEELLDLDTCESGASLHPGTES
jgi:hypothetical protein